MNRLTLPVLLSTAILAGCVTGQRHREPVITDHGTEVGLSMREGSECRYMKPQFLERTSLAVLDGVQYSFFPDSIIKGDKQVDFESRGYRRLGEECEGEVLAEISFMRHYFND